MFLIFSFVPNEHPSRIKAVYKDDTMRFRLPLDFRFVKLKEEIVERVKLELDSFDIKGLDDDHEWVCITCDEDVQEFVDISLQSEDNILRFSITDRFIFQTFDGTNEDQLRKKPSKRNAEKIESSLISSYDDLKQHFGKKLNDVAANLGG
ncbi:hypothetical protein LIER_13183 [Lithospermum erythrorhizon]|uniref:PB1 domain-containing protein n=1 Tax=Lithospermum erythrorhizon TaxID=34254 RepID=A0AAV3PWN6_LITER